MKKTILSFLTFAAIFASGVARAEEGNIYEVAACTEIGGDIAESTYPLWPTNSTDCKVAGSTAYFRLRLCSPDDSTGNNWSMTYNGSNMTLDWALFPPQICIFVSGEERWATLADVQAVEIKTFKFTDLIFKYTTKPGDFALPIVLGAKSGSSVKPAIDPELSTPEYYLDMKGKWGFEFPLTSSSAVEAKWWICSTKKPDVSRITDRALANAGYNVQTVDFYNDDTTEKGWETNNVVWRSVHEGTSITVGDTPKLIRKAAGENAVSFYVWSTNEAAVVVSGPNVEEVECDPLNNPGVKYHVARVTIGASSAANETGSFTITGVSQTANDGWSGLVLSPYNQFNQKTLVGDEYYADYVTVPVRCVDPLPPSVMVKVEDSTVYATSDYKTAATRIKLSLTQPVSESFKVRLRPAFTKDNVPLSEAQWGEYVRFSTSQQVVDALPDAKFETTEVMLGGGVTEATVFMFALRGDENTSGGASEMEFQAEAVGSFPSMIQAFNKGACQIVAQNPVITLPEEGDLWEATQFDEKPVTIKVQGSYADTQSDEGYTIYVKYHPDDTEHAEGVPSGFVLLDGTYKPGDGGTLERVGTGALPVFSWDTTGDYETKIYVVAPVSKKKSCGEDASYRTVNVTITPTKSVKVYTIDERTEFNEGESAEMKVELSEATKVDLYAFLKIESDDVTADQFSSGTPYVIGMKNKSGKCLGVKIGRGKGGSSNPISLPKLKFLDGYGPATGEYLGVDFSVVLATVQDYTTATNQSKIVKGYESDTLSLTVYNVEPTISYMQLGGFDSEESGYEYTFQLPMGQDQTLQATVKDPSTFDLENDFQCQWKISTSNTRDGKYVERKKIVQDGDPRTAVSSYNFPYKGWTMIELKAKDKDMDDWPDDAYVAYVEVLSNPTITVVPTDEQPLETDLKQSIEFGLSYYDSTIPLVMKITVEPQSSTGDPLKDGELLLAAQYREPPAEYASLGVQTNVYYLTFDNDLPQTIPIVRMDGTATSESGGFYVKAEIINEETNPKTGDKWCDYYVKNLTTRVFPYNVSPNKGDESITFWPDSNPTSRWEVAGGAVTGHPLKWSLKSDVDLDFEGGVTVSVIGGGDSETVYHGPASGTVIPDFGSSQGDQQVTIQIEDKDGGYVSRTWYFTISAAKFLTTVAHGPSTGTATIEASQKYQAASGIGEGHVYAESPAAFSSSSAFRLKWNCGSAAKIPVYAFGYKLANPTDNGSLNAPFDQALDKTGAAKSGVKVTDPYVYSDPDGRDSFFYAWIIQDVSSSSSSDSSDASETTYTVTISPEKTGASVGSVTLPTAKSENSTASDSWPETEAEAVFSREYLWSDNMGDINFDRIPDLYYNKYEFTVETETVNVTTGVSGTETETVNDLASLTLYNDDLGSDGDSAGDELPAALSASMLGVKIPEAFTAEMEIRGFGTALNNAPQLAGVAGIKPEIRYTNPDNDGSVASITNQSTLTKLEFLAWCDYAAAQGITDPEDPASWYDAAGRLRWSPERPSDPTKVDTDGDGFPDGYEYWYWYRAHVGYIDSDGNHVYQTGRKFNPRNPGQGTPITAAEIEAVMDPLVPADITAKYADNDNDGIADILELKLGTDPFDFDTDNDGLPDGWEILVSFTDPIGTVSDATANADGDAMAISSPILENSVVPMMKKVDAFQTFAVVDPNGDSAGVQWYATKVLDEIALTEATEKFYVIELENGEQYATKTFPNLSINQTLANALKSDDTYLLVEGVVTMPAAVAAGVKVTTAPTAEGDENKTDCTVKTLAAALDAKTTQACWIYGRSGSLDASKGELESAAALSGFLALGRYQEAPEGAQVCALPTTERDVAYLHSLVYQEFGFDPRTAWKSTSPLAARWMKRSADDVYEGLILATQGGYTSVPTRTRAFTAYDEFLVMSFFLNNGTLDNQADAEPTTTNPWAMIWNKYTTNPRGAGQTTAQYTTTDDTDSDTDSDTDTETTDETTTTTTASDNGADTDNDGVPDGWELYVMAGPKNAKGAYVFAPPYGGFETAYGTPAASYWSPFRDDAQTTTTDNQLYVGTANTDGLTQFREFGGTDTIAYYAGVCSNQTTAATIVRAAEDAQWINKFFPTDPWNSDTDGDGVKDGNEGSAFVYGSPEDDSSLWSIPGGGLNPCSVDTDQDGLPDEWEFQFKGSAVYSGEFLEETRTGNTGSGNSSFGLTDGMDGTVFDAYTTPNKMTYTSTKDSEGLTTNTTTVSVTINRDYDHDGLENWQEYLVGSMRCWRYDDPLSTWVSIPRKLYWDSTSEGWVFNPKYSQLGVADENEFWYRTLVDTSSPLYNPNLVTDQCAGDANYFSRVENGWDPAYNDEVLSGGSVNGAYYMFKDRVGNKSIEELWVGDEMNPGPLANVVLSSGCYKYPHKYISCSPINDDTDLDGMDDYYELFHGMNPLLGQGGQLITTEGPCDIVADAWANGEYSFSAYGSSVDMNYWQLNPPKTPRGTGYDFEVFPWLTGAADADPDGDDIRNQEEAIMPKLATKTWHHTDPTPLWLTDTSYTNSLVCRYFRMPSRFDAVEPSDVSFTYDETVYSFADFPGWAWEDTKREGGSFIGFTPDVWNVAAANKDNWAYSFEENEGYDSDHDGLTDEEELSGKFGVAEPLDSDSPHRRQAMYFQGPERPSALMSLPYVREEHPVGATDYQDDQEFLQFTVECWVRPDAESIGEGVYATILERGIWTGLSNPGDEEFLRCNFQLAIKNGRWYAKYDSRGTLKDGLVEATSELTVEAGKWTHLAATYDAANFNLYVNGKLTKTIPSGLQPEYGASAVALDKDTKEYIYKREYTLRALIFGASFKGCADGMSDGKHLDLTQALGWDFYKNFYKGFVDEVRIWDGARTEAQIAETMSSRFTADDAASNRDLFWSQWKEGRRRYKAEGEAKDSGMVPELRYHYTFDGVFAAANEESVAKVPHNFDYLKAPLSRPENWQIEWMVPILKAYTGTVYDDPRFVVWVNNTVSHLPRFDGTTWDSMFYSDDFMGDAQGEYYFQHVAEPGSRWVQFLYNGVNTKSAYRSTAMRHHLVNCLADDTDPLDKFEFTGRHLGQLGDDLIALGGAFVKTVAGDDAMWDSSSAMSNWEVSGEDTDADGLPDWWENYANENYRINPGEDITWNSKINYEGSVITAGEAYLLDLQRGYHSTESGECEINKPEFAQTADEDHDGMPDSWERIYGVHADGKLGDASDALADPDMDGLSNYQEYRLMNDTASGFGAKVLNIDIKPNVRMTTEGTIDYFVKVTGDSKYKGRYLGEIIADHDFMEDYLEDKLQIGSREKYDAHLDHDANGWSNWSEIRASENERTWTQVGLTTNVFTKIFYCDQKIKKSDIAGAADSVYYDTTEKDIFDTTNTIYKASETQTTGTNPETGAYALIYKYTLVDYVPIKGYSGHPKPTIDVTLRGVVDRQYYWSTEVTTTGTGTNAVTTTNTVLRSYSMTMSAYRANCLTNAYATFYLNGTVGTDGFMRLTLDSGDELIEGENVFIVRNGDASGYARVNVGFDNVKLDITVAPPGTVLPASSFYSYGRRLTIRRVSINDTTIPARVVWSGMVDSKVTAADILKNGDLDLDMRNLVRDADRIGIAAEDILTVKYDTVECYTYSTDTYDTNTGAYETQQNKWTWRERFTKSFPVERPIATPVAPSTAKDFTVRTCQPSFSFKGLDDVPAYELQVATEAADDKVFFTEKGLVPGADINGVKTITPALYVGETGGLEDQKTYYWRLVAISAKWPTSANATRVSAWASFKTAVDSSNADTGYGSVAVDVKYFGEDPLVAAKVIVGVYDSADFCNAPVARKTVDALNATVTLDGIAPGTYYVMAWNDANGNGCRDSFETWGYLNQVGQGVKNLYTPTTVTVESTVKEATLATVYLENTDVNDNGIADICEDAATFEEPVDDSDPDYDSDGLTESAETENFTDPLMMDTDEDGLPDGYEIWAGTDPTDADYVKTYAGTYEDSDGDTHEYYTYVRAPYYAVEDDVMAYAYVTRTVVAIEDKAGDLTYWVVPKDSSFTAEVNYQLKATDKLKALIEYCAATKDECDWFEQSGLPEDVVSGTSDSGSSSGGMVYGESDFAINPGNGIVHAVYPNIKIQLVHWQVRGEFGFESGVATPDGTVHTRLFMTIDKYAVCKYMAGGEAEINKKGLWGDNLTCLKPLVADNDEDGVPDGWELYVMFDPAYFADQTAAKQVSNQRVSPWTAHDDYSYQGDVWTYGWKYTDAEGNEVSGDPEYDLAKAWNGGVNPSNPYGDNTFFKSISDKVVRKYNLDEPAADNDRDGLSNWQEYQAAEKTGLALDVNNAYSTGTVMDYFLTDATGAYFGVLFADHDFMESESEALYGDLATDGKPFASYETYDALRDADDDGWDNWSEIRSGHNPMVENHLSLVSESADEDNVLGEYPVPVIKADITVEDTRALGASIIVTARRATKKGPAVDAKWKVVGSDQPTRECSRFIGLNPNKIIGLNIGPGSIAPSSVKLVVFDPNYQTETITYNTNRTEVLKDIWSLPHTADSSKWGYDYFDKPLSSESEIGALSYEEQSTDGSSGNATYSPDSMVNYETGAVSIDFTQIQNSDMKILVSSSDDEDVYEHYDERRSYFKLTWKSRMVMTGTLKSFYMSQADEGYLRQGETVFTAFADVNENGVWDEGEPMGVTSGVDVGWDTVNLAMRLTTTGTPRFNMTAESNQWSVVSIARTEVNGEQCARKMVAIKLLNMTNDCAVTEGDILSAGELDFDWGLVGAQGEDVNVENVTYSVGLGRGDKESLLTFTRTFDFVRSKPTIITTEETLTRAQPSLVFKMADGYPAYALEISEKKDDFSKLVYAETNRTTAANASGAIVRPACWVGWGLENNKTYYWRVAQLNSKFTENDWSDVASFTTAVGATQVAAEIRYYGATAAQLKDVVVAVYDNAGFAGVPVAKKRLAGDAAVQTLVNGTRPFMDIKTNVEFAGLTAGSYYLMAFIDLNKNGTRDAEEPWGYVNNVGTASGSLYMPMTVTLDGEKASAEDAILFIEDTDGKARAAATVEGDTDGDGVVDAAEIALGTDPSRKDTDEDGLDDGEELNYGTDPLVDDTDEDGMPDGWEVANGLDPLLDDANKTAQDDVMAQAEDLLKVYVSGDARYVIREELGAAGEVTNNVFYTAFEDARGQLYVGGRVAAADVPAIKAAYQYAFETNVVMMHSAVYDFYGFDSTTAHAAGMSGSNAVVSVNTTNFTAHAKYLTETFYLPAVGGEADFPRGVNYGETDSNQNYLPDGYELYIRYATAKDDPTADYSDELARLAIDNEMNYRFDPYGYIVHDEKGVPISNADAIAYRLFDASSTNATATLNTLLDTDWDGLTNYREYQAREKLGLTLSVTNALSDTKTPDYFRVGKNGQYAGEYFNGAEFIEAEQREVLEMETANRAGTCDLNKDGWDMWSIARNSNNYVGGLKVTGVSAELSLIIRYLNIVNPGELTNTTLVAVRDFVHTTYENTTSSWSGDGSDYSTVTEESVSPGYGRFVTDVSTVVTTADIIRFFGGQERMQKIIDENEVTSKYIPEPNINLVLKYAGSEMREVMVKAYQVNMAYPEYGEQLVAHWNVQANFKNGVAKTVLGTPAEGVLGQGPTRFYVYLDGEQTDVDSADAASYGYAEKYVGFDDCDVEVVLASPNSALPVIALDGSNIVQSVAIVRTAINGQQLEKPRGVNVTYYPNNVAREAIYPSDFVTDSFIGVDPYLTENGGYYDEKPIESVTYAILNGSGHPFTASNYVDYVIGTYTVQYSDKRDVAELNAVSTALKGHATLSFTIPATANTKYWLKAKKGTFEKVYGDQRGLVLSFAADDLYTIDLTEVMGTDLTVGDWTFSVALGNDKFGRPGDDEAAAWSDAVTQYIGDDGVAPGQVKLTVKHPTAAASEFADGTLIVAAYEQEDLANPLQTYTVPYGQEFVCDNLVVDKAYYFAAWYVVNADDGRDPDHLDYRQPYDTWGYVTSVGTNANCFTAFAIAPKTGDEVPEATIYLQDTDYNQNGKIDRNEAMTAVISSENETPADDPMADFNGNGVPDAAEFFDPVFTDPEDQLVNPEADDSKDDAWKGDLMAYEDVAMTFVAIGSSRDNLTWYAVGDGENATVEYQQKAENFTALLTTWDAGSRLWGVGRNVTIPAAEQATVWDVSNGVVRLVHAQVYAKNGFSSDTCSVPAYNEGTAVNTKPFTRADKYLVVRYLENIGVEGVSEADLLKDLKRGVTNELWYLYRDDEVDADRDGVADGWELYTMFGVTDLTKLTKKATLGKIADLKISPFNTADGQQDAPAWTNYRTQKDIGLRLLDEYDAGYAPTDPWSSDTDNDGVIDYYSYYYLLKGNLGAVDSNGNGLSNYAEYFLNEVLHVSPKVTMPREENASGEAEDYFRKFGDLYLGEIVTDHDQVGDAWENTYPEVASAAKFDPTRDDDNDGWSNYAEYRAGTNPEQVNAQGVDGNTLALYPVPVIEAEVTYNGNAVNVGKVVFKAWNEKADPEMTSAPDAIWTIGNSSATSTNSYYIGSKPSDVREFTLYGGQVAPGTVEIKVMDPNFFTRRIAVTSSNDGNTNVSYAAKARWYTVVTDKSGVLYDYDNKNVGTIDYATGKAKIDYAKLTGYVMGNPSTELITGKLSTRTDVGGLDYEVLTLESSFVKLAWSAQRLGSDVAGTHYLVAADAVTSSNPHRGRVREGLTSFVCYLVDSNSDETVPYTVGQPIGFARGVDVGWNGAKFRIELSELNPITPRFKPWITSEESQNDRASQMDDTLEMLLSEKSVMLSKDAAGVANQLETAYAVNDKIRLRVVRFGFNDIFAYLCGAGTEIRQRIVLERYYDRNARDFVFEGDFLQDGELDIDWSYLYDEVVMDEDVNDALGSGLTNVTYLAVLDGGEGNAYWISKGDDTTTKIKALSTTIERRFERVRHKPVGETVSATAGIVYGARPTFTWSIPDEEDWAKRFGSSYTAFRVQIFDADSTEKTPFYDSGMQRAPAIKNGKFTWTAPAVLDRAGNWQWRVAMFNAKFKVAAEKDWSDKVAFSTAINIESPMNDNGYSSIDVAVKYTGPETVLSRLSSTTNNGHLIVQAYEFPDFSGEALAETEVADFASVTNARDLTANATLAGLLANGTYYVRAFIDSNGNGEKDAFESWGQNLQGVVLSDKLTTAPQVGLFIEDADTDNDCIPDAYEYALAGWTGDWAAVSAKMSATVASSGTLLLSKEVSTAVQSGVAGVSTGIGGLKVTVFQNPEFAKVAFASVLGGGGDALTMEQIRDAVAKQTKVLDNTLKVTAFTFDAAAKKVTLYFDAEVETSTAGLQLLQIYQIADADEIPLTVKVYQRTSLAAGDWGEPKTKTVMVKRGASVVEVEDLDIDTSAGFFKIEVEQ